MRVPKLLSNSKPDPEEAQITTNLLHGVWGFATHQNVFEGKASSCLFHYKYLLDDRRLLPDRITSLRESNTQSADVISFITDLKSKTNSSLGTIRTWLQTNPPRWLQPNPSQQNVDKILTFAAKLWLFTRLDLSNDQLTLEAAAKSQINKIKGVETKTFVWLDFSADTLTRKGGFRIKWTSDLCEHLTFDSNSVIRVFSHASVLECYERGIER
jgi:hypothetical protein